MIIPAMEKKLLENCGDNCLILVCLEGCEISISINENIYRIEQSDVCWVPKQNE